MPNRDEPLSTKRSSHPLLEWGFLVVLLGVLIWAMTQFGNTPQIVFLTLLHVVCLQFALPRSYGFVSLIPTATIATLLITGQTGFPITAVLILLISLFLAKLSQPIWHPFWRSTHLQQPTMNQLLLIGGIHTASLWIAQQAYQGVGGQTPLLPIFLFLEIDLRSFLALSAGYILPLILLTMGLWMWQEKRPLTQFITHHLLTFLLLTVFAPPLGILLAILFVSHGLPYFVPFCLIIITVSGLIWVTWQKQYLLAQQLQRFSSLNQTHYLLQENTTLDQLFAHLQTQVQTLIPCQQVTIVEDETAQADGFTKWVLTNGRSLKLDASNMHFAQQHNISPPDTHPPAWLGAPLRMGQTIIGAITLHRQHPFTQWDHELLLAICTQASYTIQNAKLFTSTDQALHERFKQLQALLNSIQEGVLMLDKEGHVLLVNPMAEKLLGASAQTLLTHPITEESASQLGYQVNQLSTLLDSLANGRQPDQPRATFSSQLGENQTTYFIERSEAPVQDSQQNTIGWLMLFRDVTEEQKLAEKRKDVTRMIVHDLRNPVTTLISTITLIQEEVGMMAEKMPIPYALLEQAQQGCHDMLDMVDSLLDITRIEAGHLAIDAEAMHLPPLVQKVTERLQPLAHHRQVELSFQYPDDLPPIWADGEMIRRVLLNILDNALKFTPSGGVVDGRLEPIAHLPEQFETGIKVVIGDTGPGIPFKDATAIFDRFMRTNKGGAQIRGTGLGLAFCKLAIENHQGEIWVENKETGGSKFIFILPGIPRFEPPIT